MSNYQISITDERWRELDDAHILWELDGGRPVVVRANFTEDGADEWSAAVTATVTISDTDYMPPTALVTMGTGGFRAVSLAAFREVLTVAEVIARKADEVIEEANRKFEQETGQRA